MAYKSPGEAFNHFYSNDMEGLGLTGVQEVFLASYNEIKIQSRIIVEEQDDYVPEYQEIMDAFSATRAKRKASNQRDKDQSPSTLSESDAIHTPAGETVVSGERHSEEHGMSSVAPVHEHGTICQNLGTSS